jgi:hypothetical protein
VAVASSASGRSLLGQDAQDAPVTFQRSFELNADKPIVISFVVSFLGWWSSRLASRIMTSVERFIESTVFAGTQCPQARHYLDSSLIAAKLLNSTVGNASESCRVNGSAFSF